MLQGDLGQKGGMPGGQHSLLGAGAFLVELLPFRVWV